MVEEIPLETPFISALTFGGPDNRILFVTSASIPVNPYIPSSGAEITDPPAGDLIVIGDNPAPGLASYRAVVWSDHSEQNVYYPNIW